MDSTVKAFARRVRLPESTDSPFPNTLRVEFQAVKMGFDRLISLTTEVEDASPKFNIIKENRALGP
jgi:hypothetical protein